MGGGFSRHGLLNHATRRKSDDNSTASEPNNSNPQENNRPHAKNIDRVVTDQTLSPKLLDIQRDKKDDHPFHLNSDDDNNNNSNAQTFSSPRRSISSPTRKAQDKIDQDISLPRRSISSPTRLQNKINQIFSSPRQSFSSPKSKVHTLDNSKLEQQVEDVSESNNNSNNNSTPKRKDGQDEDDDNGESDYHEESDDEYGRRISDYDGLIGSPSFREYCVKDYLKPDSNTCDGGNTESNAKGDKLIISSKAKEVSTLTSVKKGRRKRGIKKVISMGNPSAMRNLLNVSACYNPHVSASRERLPKPIEENV